MEGEMERAEVRPERDCAGRSAGVRTLVRIPNNPLSPVFPNQTLNIAQWETLILHIYEATEVRVPPASSH